MGKLGDFWYFVFIDILKISCKISLVPFFSGSNSNAPGLKGKTLILSKNIALLVTIDPIHAAAMTDKKRGLVCRFTANLRVST